MRDIPPTSLIAVASSTYRQVEAENQDAVATAENPEQSLRAVLVADGLGSQAHAGLAARWAVEAASQFIERHPMTTTTDLPRLFTEVRASVKQRAQAYCADAGLQVDTNQSFGTTLLVAVEDATSLLIGYVGNGAIWHLRGNFNDFSSNQYFPWNALNYLNPHTVQNEQGKEALYRLISISDDDEESTPSLLHLQKDSTYGDILMLCTDGIYSNDQVSLGRTRDGTIWVKLEPLMPRFIAALDGCFSGPEALTEATLTDAIQRYLAGLRADRLLDDDASLGLILTAPVLAYQRQKRRPAEENAEENSV